MARESAAFELAAALKDGREPGDTSLRDVVALATLPAIWTGAEPLRIAEGLAASLFTILNPEFVYVSIIISDESAPIAIAQTGDYETDHELAERIGPTVFDWVHAHDPDHLLPLEMRGHPKTVFAATRQIGLNAELGAIAAGFGAGYQLTPADLLLLNVAATQAAVAVQNAKLLHSLRASERRANAVAEDLQRTNEDLERFAYTASHDLKAPLRTMVAFSELLLKRTDDAADKELMEVIRKAGKQATTLVENLLHLAAVGRQQICSPIPVSASDACANAVGNLRSQIDSAGATVSSNIPLEATVRIESTFLTQVFQNLIGNAIHYRKENISPRVDVVARVSGEEWIFSVADNAMGIDPAHISKIFQPFQRLHGSERPGSGIGLSTCQRIVERAQGRIWVESSLGTGSTFYFSLSKA